jgi:hypothetical protein
VTVGEGGGRVWEEGNKWDVPNKWDVSNGTLGVGGVAGGRHDDYLNYHHQKPLLVQVHVRVPMPHVGVSDSFNLNQCGRRSENSLVADAMKSIIRKMAVTGMHTIVLVLQHTQQRQGVRRDVNLMR